MAEILNLETIEYKKGAYITIEGNEPKDQFYVISDGKIRVQRSVDLADVAETDNLLVKGDYFNVIESMSGHKTMDTTDAYTNVSLIVVRKSQFTEFARRHPNAVLRFLQHFSKKVAFFNDLIAKHKGEQQKADEDKGKDQTEKIFDIAEYYFEKKKYNQALYCYVRYVNNNPNGKQKDLAKERISRITPYAKDAMNTQNMESGMVRTYKDGTMLCCHYEPGDEAYIIQEGKVVVSTINNGSEQVHAVLGEGTPVGQMSLLTGDPRNANMTAKGDVKVLAVGKDNFDMMVKGQPEMAKKLLESFADIIWKSYRQLSNLILENPLARLWDMLLVELETKRIDTSTKTPYTFDFGPQELVKMCGYNEQEGKKYIKEMLKSKKMTIEDEKIHIPSLKELEDEVKYYRNKEERDRRIKLDRMKRGRD
jgi:CRP-like cAMP-binding protein